MYKKIEHNIVEEHYAHPDMLSQMSDYNMVGPAGLKSLGINDQLPPYVMNESTMQFRMDSRTMWSKYAWGLLNYGISLNGNLPSTPQVESRMFKNSVALGDFITPYYGLSAGTKLGELLSNIGRIGIDAVKAIKSKEPLDTLQKSWAMEIDTLSKFMNELNPNNWPESLINDYFTNFVKCWVDQLQARAANDDIADAIAIDKINKIVITGISNIVPAHRSSSIADIFSRGIVAQFPSIFAG